MEIINTFILECGIHIFTVNYQSSQQLEELRIVVQTINNNHDERINTLNPFRLKFNITCAIDPQTDFRVCVNHNMGTNNAYQPRGCRQPGVSGQSTKLSNHSSLRWPGVFVLAAAHCDLTSGDSGDPRHTAGDHRRVKQITPSRSLSSFSRVTLLLCQNAPQGKHTQSIFASSARDICK